MARDSLGGGGVISMCAGPKCPESERTDYRCGNPGHPERHIDACHTHWPSEQDSQELDAGQQRKEDAGDQNITAHSSSLLDTWSDTPERLRKVPRVKRLIVGEGVAFIAIVTLRPKVVDQACLQLRRIAVDSPTKPTASHTLSAGREMRVDSDPTLPGSGGRFAAG
jgi:hypothetical protein